MIDKEKRKASQARYRAANREKLCLANKAYREANPEKMKSKAANEDPEKVRLRGVKWRQKNPEKANSCYVKWAKNNPEARVVFNQNRRARKQAGGGVISTTLAKRLYGLQRGKCACGCGWSLKDGYHLDHIMPLALGGANEDYNIQLLRPSCNSRKHSKHPIDFMQSNGFLL